ncbi:hypothetical protein [Aestuariivivens sediminis]|uniref:hypothetical protein n=1 Tax=Aestuariivivens sediminis TaxID=2913557 RepID=UPI001F55F88B|nr:hypothetical protein [Aestuariivivens sediminis]
MILTPIFILLMVLVFILVWLFASTIDQRKWVVLLITLVATPLLYFYVVYPLVNIFSSYHHEKYFNSGAWEAKPFLRYEMSAHLMASKILYGKPKDNVEELLGTCDWYSWDDSLKINSPDKWNYNLGVKPGAFNTNYEYLEIQFKNDRVVHMKQYQIEKTFE